MPVTVLTRPPNDDFSFKLFSEIVAVAEQLHNVESYYIWSNPHNVLLLLDEIDYTMPNVFICIRDNFNSTDFNYWIHPRVQFCDFLEGLVSQHPDKNFVIFTGLEQLGRELPNLKIVELGGCITNQQLGYMSLTPQTYKNPASLKTFIALNRGPRPHRITTASYIAGKQLDTYGIVTFDIERIKYTESWLDIIPWEFESRHATDRNYVLTGFTRLKEIGSPVVGINEIYSTTPNNNIENFNLFLRSMYQDVLVEIVSETTFCEPAFLITEKFLNSVYGCNFPIICSGQGAVEFLRSAGFDMFDDIINHDYDLLSNPLDRIFSAITSNEELLTNRTKTYNLWTSNKDRFLNNVQVAKKLYSFYETRAWKQFNRTVLL